MDTIDWTREFFIEKGELFLRVMNAKWEKAREEAYYIKKLLELLGVRENSLILDLGCGNGRISVNLGKLGYRVLGVDISPIFVRDAVEKAKIHGVGDKVLFKVADARRIDEELGDYREFDAVLMYWSTILGYYGEEVDLDILSRVKRITRPGGFLLILNTASYDSIVLRAGVSGTNVCYFNDIDEEYACIVRASFDPYTGTLTNTWSFYRKNGRDLVFIDDVSFKLRIYTLHEVIELAKRAGWVFTAAYHDLASLSPYRPLFSGLNVVFKSE